MDYSDFRPIFIVGMPRSSTSLVEQILSSHPDVHACGELNILGRLYKQAKSDGFENLADYVDQYWQYLKMRAEDKNIFTDKMPLNFLHIGFALKLFPDAKIIHCKRDPIDTCLSIYKKKFAGHIPFAQNLQEVSSYYRLYEDLMRFWQENLPDQIFNIIYQDLISDSENQIKNLIRFCDLKWTNACLEFYKTKRAVATASVDQVRKPIYKSAVEYWKNYEPYIGDLITEFK